MIESARTERTLDLSAAVSVLRYSIVRESWRWAAGELRLSGPRELNRKIIL